MTDLEQIEAELVRLGWVLSPSRSHNNGREYTQGWTNGKKFTLSRVQAFIDKLKEQRKFKPWEDVS